MKKLNNLLPVDGEVTYYPSFFSPDKSNIFFSILADEIAWKQEPIIIFGRSIMQPRLTAWHGDSGKEYSYSGITMNPVKWTATLNEIKKRIEPILGTKFNSALLNQYRNGNDCVGWHRDNEKELGKNPIIASVSFGATRIFHFRHCKEKSLRISIALEHGSLLIMQGATQHHWYHCIPRTQAFIEPRINITFRTIK